MSEKQATIAKEVSCRGTGLHTGKETTITFKPGEPDTGLVFVRTDLRDQPCIPVACREVNLEDLVRQTCLGMGERRIHTVEHVLAALMGLAIDNVVMELDGAEVPLMDGSALPFVQALLEAGRLEQALPRRYIEIMAPQWFLERGVELAVIPSSRLEVTFKIDYEHPAVGVRSVSFVVTPETFAKEIAPARTYCFEEDIQELRNRGLIKGGTLESAVVIGKSAILNRESLRFEDEIVRHKVLDLLGDFALLGAPLKAHIVAVRSGHAANVKFVQSIAEKLRIKDGRPSLAMPLKIEDIKRVLPHRYPFLLVDRMLEIDHLNMRFVGYKNITANEEFFQGHFPGQPVMPGVLIMEAMAQVGAVGLLTMPENQGKIVYLMSLDKVKFRRPVVPGDQLMIEVHILKLRKSTGLVETRATVDGELVCEGESTFSFGFPS